MWRKLVTKDGRELRLRPAGEDDAADLIRMIDSVAREGTYFLRSRWDVGLERERELILEAAERGDLMLVASVNGSPVGWVTVLRARPEFLRHTVELGMGVIDSLEMSYFVPVAVPPGVDGLRPTEDVEGGPGA